MTATAGIKFRPFNQQRVLLVEDNDFHVKVIETMLKKWNLQIDIAQNNEEAIRKILVSRYDILLLDMQLPSVSGDTTSQQIRRMGLHQLPILAVTVLDGDTMINIIKEGFIDGYVSKPFSTSQLYEALRKYLHN